MTAIAWTPAPFLDVDSPIARTTPSDWIAGKDGSRWRLLDATGAEEGGPKVAAGDIVPFRSWSKAGFAQLLVNPDGSFVAQGAVPAGDAFREGDVFARSIDAFASAFASTGLAEPTTIAPMVYGWSDEVMHRLVVDGAAATFEAV